MNIPGAARPAQPVPLTGHQPVLKIIGLGGGGSNAINRMIELDLKGAEFIAANTDMQALSQCLAPKKVILGPRITRGLGAGGNPATGEAAAEESYKELCDLLKGADMVFLTAGMGGGTGTGSIAVAARAAKAVGAVSVSVVTMPFSFEVGRRQRNAREGISKLQPHSDTLITVPNDQLLKIAGPNLTLDMAFRMADDVLRQGVQGISELITQAGLINVDFAHIRQIMQSGGGSLLSIGIGECPNRAFKAVEHALHHPLLDSINIQNATAIIANFTGGNDLTFLETMDAMNYLSEQTNGQAEIIPGVITDDRMRDRVQVILIITGLGGSPVDTRQIASEARPKTFETRTMESAPLRASAASQAMPLKQPLAPTMPAATTMPSHPAAQHPPAPETQPPLSQDLDVPAFLRRRSAR